MIAPVRVPETVGLKITLIVQVPPAGTEAQLSVSPKSPLTAKLAFKVALPRFRRVTAEGGLVLFTGCELKLKAVSGR